MPYEQVIEKYVPLVKTADHSSHGRNRASILQIEGTTPFPEPEKWLQKQYKDVLTRIAPDRARRSKAEDHRATTTSSADKEFRKWSTY